MQSLRDETRLHKIRIQLEMRFRLLFSSILVLRLSCCAVPVTHCHPRRVTLAAPQSGVMILEKNGHGPRSTSPPRTTS